MSKEKILNDDWRILKFSECIQQLNTGLNPRKNFTLGKGKIKYITAKNLTKSGTIDFSKCDFIDEEAKKIINKRSDIKVGDILFSSRAPIGHCHLIKEEPDFFDIGESIFSIRVNQEIVLPEYLCLYLSSDHFVKMATQNTTGSIIMEIRVSNLMDTSIIVPPKHVQKCIANCLNTIDRKIELNDKINDNLQHMAKMIYDYWFLQFDFPDESGKPYKSSGGKMVWNEELKREIPEGWEVSNLANCILKSKNGDWGNEEPLNNDDIKVNCFRGADFISITKSYDMTAPIRYIKRSNSDRLLEDGDLVTEISGGSPTQATGRIGYINQGFLNRSENVMDCSNFCKAFTPINKKYQFWLYQTWKAYYDNGAMFNYESKTTGIKNLMFDDFIDSIYVAYPISELLMKFQEICGTFYDKIQKNLLENQELASLRDFLLPLLMNGQVGFKN